jgi:hypothetical protein
VDASGDGYAENRPEELSVNESDNLGPALSRWALRGKLNPARGLMFRHFEAPIR